MCLYFVLMSLCVLGTVPCDCTLTSFNGLTIDVLDQSGAIKIYKDNEADGIVLSFDGIYEKTSDGGDITGQSRHSFNDFALLNFNISETSYTTYLDTSLGVVQFNFTANIDVDSIPVTLKTNVYHFESEGNITVDGGNVTVYPGDIKFDVKIADWPFCGRKGVSCEEGQTGAFLDFEISVSVPEAPDSITGQIASSRVITPQTVVYNDNNTKNMSTGYPMTNVTGNKTTYTFRFEPFDSVLYEPIVSLTDIRSMTYAGVTAKLLGRSGKIELTSAAAKTVVIELDNLMERDANGNDIIGDKNNRFAGKAFKLSRPINETYPNTNISVQRITGEITIPNDAMVKLNLYVFKAGGNISNGDENTTVYAGNVKFNLEISGWGFCTSACKPGDTEGMYLDIDIVIKGKKAKAVKGPSSKNTGDRYDLGNCTLILSKKVYVDGNSQPVDMATGYPMVITQGSKESFRFRFPKFTNKVVYDPIADLGNVDVDGIGDVVGGGGGASSQGTSVNMAKLLFVVATVLKMVF